MNKSIFIKQNYKNIKGAFLLMYIILFAIITFGVVINARYCIFGAVSLILILAVFCYLIRLFDSYGIYVTDGRIYYQTLRRSEVDINRIAGIKIIKSEAQVNLAWSTFVLKDKNKNELYSMIFLSDIEDGMKNYPYGDIEFLRTYRQNVVMYSVYDEKLLEYISESKDDIIIIR